MIVTCQNCDTSFQLDDARVPVQGIRVRCSRCKEAFFLRHPAASEAAAIDQVANEAVRAKSAPPPDATQDLPASSQVSAQGQGASEGGSDDEDWEFNVDPTKEPSEGAEERMLGGSGAGPSGLSLEGEDDGASSADDAAESDFGSVDDFSSLMEEDDLPGAGDLDVKRRGSEGGEAAGGTGSQAGRSVAAAVGDDASELDSWDFFSDGADAGVADSTSGAVLGRIQLTSPGVQGDRGPEPIGASDFDEDLYGPGAAPPGLASTMAARVGRGIGWVATIGLAVLGLIGGLWPTAAALVTSPQLLELGPLRAESMRGEWIETAWGETLLEVTGELQSAGAEPIASPGLLQVVLLRSDGSRAARPPQPAGLPLAEARLRELPAEALAVELSRAAYRLSLTRIDANRRQPFQAVFANVPEDAARFAIENAALQGEGAENTGSREVVLPADAPLDPNEAAVGAEQSETSPAPATLPTSPETEELTWGE